MDSTGIVRCTERTRPQFPVIIVVPTIYTQSRQPLRVILIRISTSDLSPIIATPPDSIPNGARISPDSIFIFLRYFSSCLVFLYLPPLPFFTLP